VKLYRLYNLTELGPASGLHFFDRAKAEAYKELVKWPYADTGLWPMADGSRVLLKDVDLRVETVELKVLPLPNLDLVLSEQNELLGSCPLLPGDCFDPDDWKAFGPAELTHPTLGPQLDQAWNALHLQG
jgi:hypothetical protein